MLILFATSGVVAWELNSLQQEWKRGKKEGQSNGLFIYDIQKIKNFIYYNIDMDEKVKEALKTQKGSQEGSPKL